MPSYQTSGDRASNRLKISRFFMLIFSILGILNGPIFCNAQITNTLAFEQSVLQVIATKGRPVDSICGFEGDSLWPKIRLTPQSKRHLSIEEPSVAYQKIEAGYRRSITTVLSFIDSTEVAFPVLYEDTIARKDLRTVRKSAPLALRGSDPRWAVKYLVPAALIGTGIAGIISLFYLRS